MNLASGSTLGAKGQSLVQLYLTIRERPPSATNALIDTIVRTGRAMDFAMRIRRLGRVEQPNLRAYAQLATLSEADLRLWALEAMANAGLLAVVQQAPDPVAIEEQVGVGEGIFDQTTRLWEVLGPTDLERAVLHSAEQLAYVPLTLSDHRGSLESAGHAAHVHDQVFAVLGHLGLLRRERSARLREDVIYSPYVWGSEAVSVAEFLHHLPANEREVLGDLSRAVAERPGSALTSLGAPAMVETARKVGLISATRVVSRSGQEQSFAFSSWLDRSLASGVSDVAHERKLFVAHILFGHRFGFPTTGKIRDPLVLVEALIGRGRVGPATAIGRDYPLLEAAGIVRVSPSAFAGQHYLDLVKADVAEDGLDLLRLAVGDAGGGATQDPFGGLWVPGMTFWGPERDRQSLPEISGSEAEVVGSLVDLLREQTARKLRKEDL